jgi:hypothetical protein
VTNSLQQIGWCQYPTPFTNSEGVGDDRTSYALDGYRICLWHSGKTQYGKMWDVGDVIGCGIDLETKKIEYFINGESLGIAKDNIPVGENIAYFPGISLSQEEKVIFNFGQSPLCYSYPGYEVLDIPQSIFNMSVEITAEILDMFKTVLINALADENKFENKLTPFHKISLTNKLYNFLISVSFKDLFIFKTLLIPFLFELNTRNSLSPFFKYLFVYMNLHSERISFVTLLFDNLCGLMEENGIKGAQGLEDWKNLVSLLISLVEINEIVELWIESGKTTENLKMVFNNNSIKMRDIADFIKLKYPDWSTSDKKVNVVFKEIKDEFYQKHLAASEAVINSHGQGIKKILNVFLNDSRFFKAKLRQNEDRTTLKSILSEFVNKGNDLVGLNNALAEILVGSHHKKDNTPFYKTFIFGLYNLLQSFNNIDLSKFSCEAWFKRLSQTNLFYDEVGLGGTISHVTSEYISKIDQEIKEGKHSDPFLTDINQRTLKISSLFVHQLKEMIRVLDKTKLIPLKQLMDFENGTDHFKKVFRSFYYLTPEPNLTLLYTYSFFLIKWINTLIRRNPELVYFIPKSVFDVPFEIFRYLHKVKASVLYVSEHRTVVNQTNKNFLNDDWNYEMVFFYTSLFADPCIANPELKESLIQKMKFFIKKKAVAIIFEEKPDLLEKIIKGLLHYMSIENLCHIACEIMVKIIKPICFGEVKNFYEKNKLVEVTKKFFESDVKTFHEFMQNYSKLINKVMTDYTIVLNEAANKILNSQGHESNESKSALLKQLFFTHSILCDLMKIFEFLLAAYPFEFFDISSLNYSRFLNFLKNTSSRILENTYITQLIKLSENASNNILLKIDGKKTLTHMAFSFIGIFLNIEANRTNPKFKDFIKKLANLPDLDMEPFLHLYTLVSDHADFADYAKSDPSLIEGLAKYKEIIEYFIVNREKKRERTMSVFLL